MKLRNYCLVVMGDLDGVKEEIRSISDSEINTLDAKGILIATFASYADPNELTDFLKFKERNFLIFDLNKKYSGYNILKDDIDKALFGFLIENSETIIRAKTQMLIQELTSSTVVNEIKKLPEKKEKTKLMLNDIDKMSIEDKENLMNMLIEKGPDKLSTYDKKILKKLANS